MGQSEYGVGLSPAKPEQMDAVAFAFRAGEQKAVETILNLLDTDRGCGDWATHIIREEYKIEANTN